MIGSGARNYFNPRYRGDQMAKITEKEIIDEVYNLILNKNVQQDERVILVNFKNNVGAKADFQNELMKLGGELQQLAVKNLSNNKKMSFEVSEFSKKIAYYGELKSNWARGLLMMNMIFR